ncbi:MAG: pilus assembly protein TadG-related protein [Kiritimatiellae bacterium]|nr:pilus assembly protein TadG-related protein [Kiritimatiellia bacterium]
MLKAANRAAVRLWQDESGVVLAVSTIVFLTLFMMASAIFSGGEKIRCRIELQNAADAAAYSAAVVQADTLSRVAAVNRAMSWTYVQMVRMEMDYIVDKWLWLTLKRWNEDNRVMRNFNRTGTCHIGLPYYSTGKGGVHKRILLNKKHYVTKEEIESARKTAAKNGRNYSILAPKIDQCRERVSAMNEKEREMINKLPQRARKTVEETLRANTADTWNDGFAGGGGLMYALKQEEQPLDKNFRVLELDDEEDFLRHSDYIPKEGKNAKLIFKNGTDDWFVKEYKDKGPGVQRQYKRGHPILVAEWDYKSTKWVQTKKGCVKIGQIEDKEPLKGPVKGDDNEIYDEQYYITENARPQVLREEFFAKGGSLVVGLTRRMNNPFKFMFPGQGEGVMKPFTLDGGNRYMWTVSAALAGYNPKPREDAKGRYEVTYEDNSQDKLWNLKTSDWDAVLLPLHRAWAKGTAGRKWQGETAGQILDEMKGGPWQPLYGGGGALGTQGAPKLMGGGGEVSYGGAEAWVLH